MAKIGSEPGTRQCSASQQKERDNALGFCDIQRNTKFQNKAAKKNKAARQQAALFCAEKLSRQLSRARSSGVYVLYAVFF